MDPQTIILQAVGGFVVGGLIGYVLRKAAKWVLVAVGFMLLPIFLMWQAGLLYVNWDVVNELVGRFINWLGINLSSTVTAVMTGGAFGISMALGFLFGIAGLRHEVFPDIDIPTRRFVRRRR